MASLAGREISKTFKDLLHVYSGTEGEGLESGAKRIYDGEGIASAILLSTNALQVGDSSTSANMDVYGDSIAKAIKLRDSNNSVHDVLGVDTVGTVQVKTNLETKGAVTFTKSGYDNLIVSAEHGTMEKGDGSKGKVKLGDTSVSLRKGTTDLLVAKEDGTIRFKNISTGNEPTPATGDLALINGELQIGV